MIIEEWRAIEENQNYEVSNHGRVRVKERVRICGNGGGKHIYPAKIMSVFLHDNGKGKKNLVVQMRDGKRQIRRSVATLVLMTFAGKPPKLAKQPKHIDGDIMNNKLSNLKWDVDRSYGLPPNETARQLFDKYAYSFIKSYIHHKQINLIKFGYMDASDFMQECAIRIWNVIDLYSDDRCSFKRFVFIKCEWIFNKMYAKYKQRERIAPTKHIESEMVTEELPIDYIKELSYREAFYGD